MSNELFLWDHPVSSYAQKVRIALREKKIPFRFETPKGVGSGNAAATTSSFFEGNLRVEVPVLVDGQLKIVDSTIILEYIEDKYPDVPLRPADPAERAKARMIEDLCDSQYEAINWAMGEVFLFKRLEGDEATKMKEQARHQTEQVQGWLTEQLGNATWFGGEQFGWADVCVAPLVNRSVSMHMLPEAGTRLREWYDRVKERESVKSVFEEVEEGLKGMAGAVDRLNSGQMKREYRDHRLEFMIKSGGFDVVAEGLKKDNIRFSWPDPQK